MLLRNQGISNGHADRILDFFEGVAFFVRREHLGFEVIENEYSLAVRVYWSRLKPRIDEIRAEYFDQTYYEHLECLNDRFLTAYADETGSTVDGAKITEKQANGFFASEMVAAEV